MLTRHIQLCPWEQGLDLNNNSCNWHQGHLLLAWHLTRGFLSLNHRLSALEGDSHYHCPSRGPEPLRAAQGCEMITESLGHGSGSRPGEPY